MLARLWLLSSISPPPHLFWAVVGFIFYLYPKGVEMLKYDPLRDFLSSLPSLQIDITLSFQKIEEIINFSLPPSAYEYPAWWANEQRGRHVNAFAWLDAGWKVDTVNRKEKWVRFRRD
jgi:hypothetical protein